MYPKKMTINKGEQKTLEQSIQPFEVRKGVSWTGS